MKFTVSIMRTTVNTVDFEVEATSAEEAEKKAMAEADIFDWPEGCNPDIEVVLAEETRPDLS